MDEITARKKTQELYSSINNLIKNQNIEIKNLSEKLNVKEDVIRNIMREERPVVTKRNPSTAFDFFCAQRRIEGADEKEDIDAWRKLPTFSKSMYYQTASGHNNEQKYETVQYIEDENERKHALKQRVKELKNLCKTISQECGYQFLIVGIEPNIESSIAFGTNVLKDFCSDKEATIEQIKNDLIDYNINNKPNDQEKAEQAEQTEQLKQTEQIIDDSKVLLSAVNNNVTHEQELSEQKQEIESTASSSINESEIFTDNSKDHDSTLIVNEQIPNSISANDLSYHSDNFNKKRRDMMESLENDDNNKDFNVLVSKDVCDVNLESTNVRSMVYKYLENKFQQDTKLKISIPYDGWNKQESFVVSGWPRNVEFKEWDVLNANERKKVYIALNRLQFHVRLDSNLSKERRASKKKRFV